MSHERCCYDLQNPLLCGALDANDVQIFNYLGFDGVPAILDVRFKCAAPTTGNVAFAVGVWDNQAIRLGVVQEVRTFVQIANDVNLYEVESGFTVSVPQGMGRQLAIFNTTDVQLTNLTVFIRFLTTTTVAKKDL